MNVLTPTGFDEALQMASAHPDYRLIAGGSDWMVEKDRQPATDGVISLRRIDLLRHITASEKGTLIGATATVSEIASHPLIRSAYPVLVSACAQFGSRQIRNVATIGGNVAHASPAADLVPVLHVLGAQAVVESIFNRRQVPIGDLILSKGRTSLSAGEIIRGILLPDEVWEHGYYHKVGRRSALNIAVASLCALGRKNANGGWEVRLGGASLSPSPRRFASVEALFARGIPHPEEVREALKHDIDPRSGLRGSAEYRFRVTENMLQEFAHALA